jgi:uncharacterized membrane protein YphA (DoxX/SURF4 family)
MLSVFPELLNYSQVAPFILRIFLAVALLQIGYKLFKSEEKKEKIFGIIEILSAIFLAIGMFTQVAAIVSLIAISNKTEEKSLRLLTAAVSISLALLGPGIFSFDLPL